jgi:hypothetical protein
MFAAAFARRRRPRETHWHRETHGRAYALVFGVSLLVLSFRLRARAGPTAPSGGLRSGDTYRLARSSRNEHSSPAGRAIKHVTTRKPLGQRTALQPGIDPDSSGGRLYEFL